jgi:hypothetical protein
VTTVSASSEVARVVEPPLGDALVGLDEAVARPDEVGEHCEDEAAEDDPPSAR